MNTANYTLFFTSKVTIAWVLPIDNDDTNKTSVKKILNLKITLNLLRSWNLPVFVQEFLFDPSSLVVLTLFGHAVIICRSQSVN